MCGVFRYREIYQHTFPTWVSVTLHQLRIGQVSVTAHLHAVIAASPDDCRATTQVSLKVFIHVRVWLASPAGLGFQGVKLVRVWGVTSRTLADYIYTYTSEPGSRVKLPEADSRARLVRVWAPLPRKTCQQVICKGTSNPR
jgi:hypothetical protein